MAENPREPGLDKNYHTEVEMEGSIEYNDSETFLKEINVRLQEIALEMNAITNQLPTLESNVTILEKLVRREVYNRPLLTIAKKELATAQEKFAELLKESGELEASIEYLAERKRKRAILLNKFPKDNPQ